MFISDIAKKLGLHFVLVSANFQLKNGGFSEYIEFVKWEYITIRGEIIPDFLWNRVSWGWSYLTYKTESYLFPSNKILEISQNKYLMYRYLHKYMPKTFLLRDFLENISIRDAIGEQVVLKPVNSSWWAWVEFYSVSDLVNVTEKHMWLGYLLIVQEFLDFSHWIPWIVEGMHDFRLVFVNGELSYTSLRTPAQWLKKSNVGSGWTESIISKDKVPPDLMELAKNIIDDLDIKDWDIFSLDFWFCLTQNKWYLIELNDFPWIWFLPEQYFILENYITDVFKTLR